MIYPSEVGKPGELARLRTLESVWLQGKLKMWGRWAYIGGGSPGNMFNQLLASKKITKNALQQALQHMANSGMDMPELRLYLNDLLASKQKSSLAFCTDNEALLIDHAVAQTLIDQPALIALLRQRYEGRGKSKRQLADELHARRPEWSQMTCRRRIDTWLNCAEAQLYRPVCDVFGTNSERFYLQSEPELD